MNETAIFEKARQTPKANLVDLLNRECAGDSELRARVEARLTDEGTIPDESGTVSEIQDPNRTTGFVSSATGAAFLPTIPGFEIEAELGRGGMGVVYQARQVGLNRTVALKMILRAEFATAEQKLRFRIEAENAARVQHPHIVQVYEVGEHLGQPYFALEFIDGGSLAEQMKQRRHSPREAAALIETLARAAQAAHQQGVVHRDLKPANVLLDQGGAPKVADFGLAKRLDAADELTGSGAIMGTPSYMSPEQARGQTRHVGPAADQYALGVIFYQLLTGQLPFQADSTPDLLRQIVEGEPAPPRRLSPGVPPDLQVICLKCLEKEPARRYPSAEALADDLKNWREHRPIAARAATRLERVTKWCRRYPAGATLIAVSVVAALVAGGLATWALSAERAATLAAANEKAANDLTAERLAQIELINNSVFNIFTDFNIRNVKQGSDPVEQVLAQRLIDAGKKLDAKAIHDPLVLARLQTRLGHTLTNLGRPKEAIEFLEPARDTRRVALGIDHPDTLQTMSNLGLAYHHAGQYLLAQPLIEETLRREQNRLGYGHADTITLMNNLGLCYQASGQRDLALRHNEETLQLARAKLGSNDQTLLMCMANLANCYLDANQLDRAKPLLEEVLHLQKTHLGPDNMDTLFSMSNLARYFRLAGKYEEAQQFCEETLELTTAKLGRNHLNTLMYQNELAVVLQLAGRNAEALAQFEQLLPRYKAHFGIDHPETFSIMNNVAALCHYTGRLSDAILLYEQILSSLKEKGPDHPDVLLISGNLASAYHVSGQSQKALPLFEQVLAAQKKKLGADHPDTLNTMNNLAVLYSAAAQYVSAQAVFEEIVDKSTAKLGADHPETLIAILNLANTHRKNCQPAQAVALVTPILPQVRTKLGVDHDKTLLGLSILGRAYLDLNEVDKAEAIFREAVTLREKKEPDAWTTFDMYSALGAASLGQKKYTDAEVLLLKGYEGLQAREGKIPPSSRAEIIRRAAKPLVSLYTALERPDDVQKWQAELAKYPEASPLPPEKK